MADGDVHFYEYTDDNNNLYAVRLTERVARNGGFTLIVDATGMDEWFNTGKQKMRHVGVRLEDGRRGRIPCPDPDAGLYLKVADTISVDWPNDGNGAIEPLDAVVTGRIGEKGAPN